MLEHPSISIYYNNLNKIGLGENDMSADNQQERLESMLRLVERLEMQDIEWKTESESSYSANVKGIKVVIHESPHRDYSIDLYDGEDSILHFGPNPNPFAKNNQFELHKRIKTLYERITA